MTFAEYADYDGLGLAGLVARGEVSPVEVVDAAIERVERHNGTLNAVIYKAYDEARAAAAGPLPDGPFRGVPFLVKDLFLGVAGWPRTSGSRFLANAGLTDREDSGLMKRYRASGLVALGKSNLCEFGMTGTTEPALFGACRNPWDIEHIAGGSSGGSAAAVASGMVPIAHAGDGLGSIRIPASCCGLVGLKVTRDRNPHLPDVLDFAVGNVVEHVVTRTVRDSAAILDVTGLPEPASPYPAPPRARPYMEELEAEPGRLRIAWSKRTPLGAAIDPEVARVVEETARLLEGLGHHVEEREIDADLPALYRGVAALTGANFAAFIKRTIEEAGRDPLPGELEPNTEAAVHVTRGITGEQALYALQERRRCSRQVLQFFETWDVFLSPVMSCPPPKLGYLNPVTVPPKELQRRSAQVFPFAAVFNHTGQPSISLPLGWSDGGLPIGMMFSGRYGDEATLIRLASQLEQAAPWSGRKPPIWG